ncbi:MAG: hypothetical protein CL678_17365 [Bdellovibrionaceae bacterium]|nr:hypothetical protein [Pseudobdellovibrionaceae bacterium]
MNPFQKKEPLEEKQIENRFRLALLTIVAIGVVFQALIGFSHLTQGFFLSLGLLAFFFLQIKFPNTYAVKLGIAIGVCLSVGTHYLLAGDVIRALNLETRDYLLFQSDQFLLGWLFPDGQLALALDQSTILNPETFYGKTLIDFFSLVYISFFVWGVGLVLYLLAQLYWTHHSFYWKNLRRLLTGWGGVYIINFVFYVCVPAIGPRYYRMDLYQHSMDGWGISGVIQHMIRVGQDTPWDCFPSGHTAMSWLVAFAALQMAPRYGRITLVVAVLMTLSTLILRYHYFTDLVFSVFLIALGVFWGGFLRKPQNPERSLSERD